MDGGADGSKLKMQVGLFEGGNRLRRLLRSKSWATEVGVVGLGL